MTQESTHTRTSFRDLLLPGLFTAAVLCALAPLYLRLPITNDAVLYDLEARWMHAGLFPYREIVEPNFPGVLLIHRCVRSICGESNLALRLADLCLVTLIIALGGKLIAQASQNLRVAIWGIGMSFFFYLSQSEWCHCQRDVWLLFPTLLALDCRRFQVKTRSESTVHGVLGLGFVEGILWGCGIWLKPHLLVVCVVAWGLSLGMPAPIKRKAADACGLLLGGLLAGGVGIGWLAHLEILESFFVSLQKWNPGYLRARFDHWTFLRYAGMSLRFAPWILFHITALPLACFTMLRFIWILKDRTAAEFARVLLSAVYLVWMLQAHFLQHLFDYVHVPSVFLAIFLTVAHAPTYRVLRSPVLLGLILSLACWTSPLARTNKMKLWTAAVRSELTAAQTDQLAHFDNPNWEDLEKVEQYLAHQDVNGKDVLMYNSDVVTLYWNLNLQSPTPYVYMYELLNYFPERQVEFQNSMTSGSQKFIVTDLVSCGMSIPLAEEVDAQGPLAPPPVYRRYNLKSYPWTEPVVFRSGRYLVHKVRLKTQYALPDQSN